MKTNCEYCGAVIDDSDEKCGSCGATNAHYRKVSINQPRTIEELKQWYQEKKLPSEELTRFFIGKNINEKKAFGIYKDETTGKVVVYKNKDDGTRAIRYEGRDEAYAVNEFYQKLREVMIAQKNYNVAGSSRNNSYKRRKGGLFSYLKFLGIVYLACISLTLIVAVVGCNKKNYFEKHPDYNHYYEYDDEYYYNLGGDYYYYDNDDEEWSFYGDAPFDEDNYEDYKVSDDYSDHDVSDFEDTDYYGNWYDDFYNSSSNNDSYDYDDDWDSGWDSNDSWDADTGVDWGSDW